MDLSDRLAWVLLLAGCGGADEALLVPRIIDGVDVDKRNGAVQLRITKPVDGGAKIGLCTGALVGKKCVVTAGHCVEFFGQEAFLAGTQIWHPAAANNDEDGKATPAKGETVTTPMKVAVLGRDQYRDLAVVLLKDELPGPTLSLSATAPKAGADATVLGNGTTEKKASGHRQSAAGVIGSLPDPKDADYASYALLAVGKQAGKVAEGDSGGPALYGTGIFGIAHGADPDTNGLIAAFTDLHATKTRAWLKQQLKDVCGIERLPEVDDGAKPKDDTGSDSGVDWGSDSGTATGGDATTDSGDDGEPNSDSSATSSSSLSGDGQSTSSSSTSGDGESTSSSSGDDGLTTSGGFPPDVGGAVPIHEIDATPIDVG